MHNSPMKVKVGSWYDVPCIKDPAGVFVPIIGPSHSDGPEICSEPTLKHYHYDYRFTDYEGKLAGILDQGQDIVYIKKQCIRQVSDNGKALWGIVRLARMYQEHKIDINNPVCPHQGIPLVNKSGLCPGHGLCWNMQTGRLKYTLPFYARFKGTKYKVFINDRERIEITNYSTKIFTSPIIQVIDSKNKVIGEHKFEGFIVVAPKDKLYISTGCTDSANKK